MKITAWVEGTPKAQPRARAFARGGKARLYTPGTAEHWKGQIALAFKELRPETPIASPVRIFVGAVMPRPGRLCRKKDPVHALPHDKKPDPDNIAKAILDALTTIGVWEDDKLVSDLRCTMVYAARVDTREASGWLGRATPGAHIEIETIDSIKCLERGRCGAACICEEPKP